MTTLILGTETAEPEALAQMHERGGRWAAYQNHDLGSAEIGRLMFLQVGPGRTFEEPPKRYPDTQHGLGWRYLFVGWVDLETGAIQPVEEDTTP